MKTSQRIRLLLLAAAILGGSILLLYRLWELQMDRQSEFVAKLPETDKAYQRVPGPRGRIFDRDGIVLASNENCLEIGLNLAAVEADWKEKNRAWEKANRKKREIPKYTYDPAKEPATDIIALLNETVFPALDRRGLYIKPPEKEVAKIRRWYLTNKGVIPYRYHKDLLQTDSASFERFVAYAENAPDLAGIVVRERQKRRYPMKAMAAHVIGYLSENEEELPPEELNQKEFKWDFAEADDIGRADLEKSQDAVLRGKPGRRVWLKNEHGRLTEEIESERVEPLPGANIYLSIEATVEYIVETTLREAGVGRGAAVVMDPNTGEVIAMVSVPSYDPNTFIPPQDMAAIRAMYQDTTSPPINRALGTEIPGSTFKLITALAGSLAGIGGRSYHCSGSVNYGREFNCWTTQKNSPPHGSLNLEDAVRSSCNCFFYQYGNEAGIDRIETISRLFSFGSASGIELDSERIKPFPGKSWWATRNMGPWTKAKTANISIGQGEIVASPLQMCMVAAAIATGGKIYQPTLIHRVEEFRYTAGGQRQKVVSTHEPKLKTDLVKAGVKERDLKTIKRGMWEVVHDPRGTAKSARSPLVEIAGKTGTAQHWRRDENGRSVRDNNTWFVSFAPFENPQLAVAVIVSNGEAGGKVVAPIVRRIIEQTLALRAGSIKVVAQPLEPATGHFKKLDSVTFPDMVVHEEAEDGGDTGESHEPAEEVREVRAVPDDEQVPKAEVIEEDVRAGAVEQPLRRVQFRMKNDPQF